ncbi:MAG: phosphate regulon sensor histidine kinase PhoR [Gammaproteobacteria bacterium]|nr:phosphate regulon sensor histidine kinase PhoR [Gammaproteobacteria bacterium]
MHPNLWREIWVVAFVALGALLLGLATDHPFLSAVVVFGGYIAVVLYRLHQLQRWLFARGGAEIPDAEGIWGDVFKEIRKLVRQAETREDRLAGMVERFQNAAAAMPDAVVIVSQNDEIEWANPASGLLLGITYPRDGGLRLGNLLRSPEFAGYLRSRVFSEPIELSSPANPRKTVLLQIIPFGASQKLIIGRDVTRLLLLEQMRRNFVANVSHELRTPITVLSGFLETLRAMKQPRAEELEKHLAVMHEQALRMQRLVDDLLTLSKLETTPPSRHDEPVDVPALLGSLKDTATLLSGERRHRITLEADTGLTLLGDPEELRSAFSNLINNAVQYTPPGGNIELRWQASADGAYFSVRDSGTGIAPEHIPRLTERFYRVDSARSRATGGTGLGLSIVKHVLVRHDAVLDIASEPGKGSTFSCRFPAARVVPR